MPNVRTLKALFFKVYIEPICVIEREKANNEEFPARICAIKSSMQRGKS